MKRLLALLAVACFALPAAAAEPPAKANRLVLQVNDDDPKKWNAVLNNARNIQADLGKDNIDIEIVAHGGGIGMLKHDAPVAARAAEMMGEGVRLIACRNTMATQKIAEADMAKNIDYTKAGLVHLMQRQQQGWIYVRP